MKKNTKIKWRDKFLSHKTVSTAVQNYLERNGYKVNRKCGIDLDFNGCWAKVERV